MLYGTSYRAVVVHSSAQDKRRQQRLARDIQASYSTIESIVRPAVQREYFCRADAEAAAARRSLPALCQSAPKSPPELVRPGKSVRFFTTSPLEPSRSPHSVQSAEQRSNASGSLSLPRDEGRRLGRRPSFFLRPCWHNSRRWRSRLSAAPACVSRVVKASWWPMAMERW